LVKVTRGWLVRAVKLMTGTGVWVGVRVRVGVRVGVQVGLEMSVAVAVGAVDVGKGPSSAPEVSASAVRVLLALRCISFVSGVTREVNLYTARITPRINSKANTIMIWARFSLRVLKFTLAALLRGTRPGFGGGAGCLVNVSSG
jgi:hypothetical protein